MIISGMAAMSATWTRHCLLSSGLVAWMTRLCGMQWDLGKILWFACLLNPTSINCCRMSTAWDHFAIVVHEPWTGEATRFRWVCWMASTGHAWDDEKRKTGIQMGGTGGSHHWRLRNALCASPPSADKRWRLRDSRFSEPLARASTVPLRFFGFHHDCMPSSESFPNLTSPVDTALSMEQNLHPFAMFHPWSQLDSTLETFWNSFRCGTLEQGPAMCTHSWPWAGLVSPLVRWKHASHECMEVLDPLQPICAFFVQPRAMMIDAARGHQMRTTQPIYESKPNTGRATSAGSE